MPSRTTANTITTSKAFSHPSCPTWVNLVIYTRLSGNATTALRAGEIYVVLMKVAEIEFLFVVKDALTHLC